MKSAEKTGMVGARFTRLDMKDKNGYMSAPLFFPSGMFAKPIIPKEDFDEEEI